MRRRALMVFGIASAVMGTIGLLVWSSQKGTFEHRVRRLFTEAKAAEEAGRLAQAQGFYEELVNTFPESPLIDKALLQMGRVQAAQEHFAQAKQTLNTLLKQFSESPLITEAQEVLGAVNVSLLLTPTISDGDEVYVVKPGDTLGGIAAHNGTTVELVKRINGLEKDTIYPKQQLKIPAANFSIVVDKSQNRLLISQNGEFMKSYTVATGKDNSTPVGTFKVINKIPNPVWYKQGAVVPPDSPENILGTRWLGLDVEGYGIHGSVDPDTLGQQVTAGCVRMRNSDVEEVFTFIPVGTEVTIVN